MSEKIPFYRYPYAASVATAEDPDYEPPEEEEAEDPDSSLEAEGVQDVAVGVSHWVDGTPRVELDLLVLQQQASQAVRDLRPAVPQVAEVLGGPDGGTWLSPGGLSARELSALDGVVFGARASLDCCHWAEVARNWYVDVARHLVSVVDPCIPRPWY